MERIEVNLQTGAKTTIQLTDEEVDALNAKKETDEYKASERATARRALKLTGIEILGVMCSATKEDQQGMIAIGFDKLTNTMAGTQMGSTTMEFKNGSELVITDENFSEVDALWRPFRKSFF